MAKALLGYAVSPDARLQTRLAAENRHMRQRIADLETALAAAHIENEALTALVARESDSVLEPA
ncbi:MAG TPA: hypothetical protein VN108_01815 [Marmoricola sp.]|nr:hypothetical protein [Marmoricola sp.]